MDLIYILQGSFHTIDYAHPNATHQVLDPITNMWEKR